MAPHPISIIDDSDDIVILPRGCTTGRAGAMADNPDALRELNKGQQLQTTVGYVADTEGRKSHNLMRPTVGPASLIDDSSDVGIRKSDNNSSAHRTEARNKFENIDPGAKKAYKTLMAKVDNARKNGYVEIEDENWKYDLHLVHGGKTTSLLSNAVNTSSANRANLPSSNFNQVNIPQEYIGHVSETTPAAHSVELRGNQKAALANHVGGVPFPAAAHNANALVAHELTDEERGSKPTAHVLSSKYCGQREDIPRFGFLIPGANGKTRLVNNSNSPVLTYRGAEAPPSRSVAQSPAAALTPAGGANYQAPTVESVSDSGDLAGLFA